MSGLTDGIQSLDCTDSIGFILICTRSHRDHIVNVVVCHGLGEVWIGIGQARFHKFLQILFIHRLQNVIHIIG